MVRRYQKGKDITEVQLLTILPVEEWDGVQMTWRPASVKMHTAGVRIQLTYTELNTSQ